MVEVTVIGDVNIDVLTQPISSYPEKDSQDKLEKIYVEVGGGAGHISLALARLGVKTKIIGLVGKDVFGDFIYEEMKKFGVVSGLRRSEENTGISIGINFEDGSRSLLTYRGTNKIFSSKNFKIEEIKGRVLFVSGYNLLGRLQTDIYQLLKYAKQKDMITCLEPDMKSGLSFDMSEFKKCLGYVDFFFPDLEEGRLITKEKDEEKIAEKVLSFGCKTVALKLGKRGCLVADGVNMFRIGSFDVKALNSTGAGDFFNAGFLFGYMKHKRLELSGLFGSATAAFAISRFGDERYPSEDKVKKLVKNVYEK